MDIAAKKYFVNVDGTLKSGKITASVGFEPADRESVINYFRRCNDERVNILTAVDYMPDDDLPKCSIHLGVMGRKISVEVKDAKTGEMFSYTVTAKNTYVP